WNKVDGPPGLAVPGDVVSPSGRPPSPPGRTPSSPAKETRCGPA
ncbi:MAG: hypothetical protein AVDCRST_MAG49-1279, partial [uncultured Thermomicrobiales bacterium]